MLRVGMCNIFMDESFRKGQTEVYRGWLPLSLNCPSQSNLLAINPLLSFNSSSSSDPSETDKLADRLSDIETHRSDKISAHLKRAQTLTRVR